MSEEKNTYKYVLSKKIMFESTLTGSLIYGVQRSGKSSYSLQVLHEIYNDDWDEVFNHVLFRLEDVIGYMKKAIKSPTITPCFCWDDCGVYGNNQIYFTKRESIGLLKALFDVIGTRTRGILLTSPDPSQLLKALRSYEFYKVKVIRQNQKNRRIARGYANYLLPSGMRRVRKIFEDYYDVMLPSDVWKQYMQMRESFLEEAVLNLDEHISEVMNRKHERKN